MTDPASEPGHPEHGSIEAGYLIASRRPLSILLFLLPLVVLYELSMLSLLQTESGTHTNRAHKTLLMVFEVFGVQTAGWYLPGAALVLVLLVWQVLSRQSWVINVRVLPGMLLESIVLAVPLVVISQLFARLVDVPTTEMNAIAPDAAVGFAELSLPARLGMSIGAGLYEELVFRMLLIAIIHLVLVDLLKVRQAAGVTIAIVVSALLFSLYHFDLADPGTSFSFPLAIFYLVAGGFFGAVYVARGFGIVVGVHALYDVVMAVLLSFGGQG